MVPSDVAGEGDVLDAENADGERPLGKWATTITAEGCTDEYTDDPHAKHASENVQDGDDLSETLSGTCAHDPCEYDEDGFEGELLGSSRSMAGQVVATSGVSLDVVSVSKLRKTCAQRRASVHEAPM